MTEAKKSRTWETGPFVLFGAFVCFILGIVLYVSLHESELEEDHPYEKGLAYQSRIDQLRRTAENDSSIVVEHRAGSGLIVVRFPNVSSCRDVAGEVRLVRPSHVALDRRWPIQLGPSGAQVIPVADLVSGLWRIEIDWKVDSVSYYYQKRLTLP
ncbi:MAG: FixH family protein [candidate division Zixibacteria bacterium]|nr:FixH family protein [candidate division Zixibacteria bacterium]